MKNDLESMDLFIQIRQDCGLASLACSGIHVIIHIQISFFRNSLSKYILFSTYLIKNRSLLNVYRRCQCRKIVRKTQLCLYFDEKLAYFLLVQNEAEGFLNLHLCLKHHFSLEINQTKQSFWFFGQNIGLKSIVLRNIIFSSECKK